MKRLEEVTEDQIRNAFNMDHLNIFTNPKEFKEFLFSQELQNNAILLMSSGNYGGLDFEEVKRLI